MKHKNLAPLFPAFNRMVELAINAILPQGFDITGNPNLCYPFYRIKKHYHLTGRVRIWNGASDNTIFGDPHINYAFRAWHDAVHIMYNLPFTKAGEHAVMLIQKKHCSLFGKQYFSQRDIMFFHNILECEIDRQLDYFIENNIFPVDQRAFTKALLTKYTRL